MKMTLYYNYLITLILWSLSETLALAQMPNQSQANNRINKPRLSNTTNIFDIDTKLCLINATDGLITINRVWSVDASEWNGPFLPANLTNQSVKSLSAACWPLTLAYKINGGYQFNIEIGTDTGPIVWDVSQYDSIGEIDNDYSTILNTTKYKVIQKAGDNNGFATNVFILEGDVENKHKSLSQWMRQIPDSYTLKNIQLIGSHDAGVNRQDGVSCNVPSALAVAQKSDLKTQLSHGVRYFDIRLEEGSDNLHYPYHKSYKFGCTSNKNFEKSLQEILDFMKTNTSETVFLKISHSTAPVDGIMTMLDKWTQSPDNQRYFYKSNSDTYHWTDKTIAELRGKIVLLLDCEFIHYLNPLNGYFGFSTIKNGVCDTDDEMKVIYDQFTNTLDYDQMSRDQLEKLKLHGNDADKLFLLSWTMTGGDIVAHTPRPAANLIMFSNNAFGKTLPLPNIIYYDFEDPGINTILISNYLEKIKTK